MRAPAAEGKLQHPHARQIELLAQRIHLTGDQSEILGDQRQLAELFAQRGKERRTRRLDPFAMNGGLILSRDCPERFKATKVIEPDDVVECTRPAHAVYPPVKAPALQHIPLVERIAPPLAGLAEIVGRHTRDANGREVFEQLENFRVGPHIGAVVIDKNSHIPNEAYAALRAVGA